MNEQKKMIALIVLVVILIVTAVIVFGRSTKKKPVVRPKAAASAVEAESKLALLSGEDIESLRQWLGGRSDETPTANIPSGARFGLPSGALAAQTSGARTAASAGFTPTAATGSMGASSGASFEGVMTFGSCKMALLGGMPYEVGQTVATTDMRVAEIGENSVKLTNDRGDVTILELQR